jgi:hypothetical protein
MEASRKLGGHRSGVAVEWIEHTGETCVGRAGIEVTESGWNGRCRNIRE